MAGAVLRARKGNGGVLTGTMQVYRAYILLSIHLDCRIDFIVIQIEDSDGEKVFTAYGFMDSLQEHDPYRFINIGARNNVRIVRFICEQKQLIDNDDGVERNPVSGSGKVFECGG